MYTFTTGENKMASNSKLLLFSTEVSSSSLVISDVPNPETIDLQYLSSTVPTELIKNTAEDYLKSQIITNALANGWIRLVSQPVPESDPIPTSAQYNELQSYSNKSNKIVLSNTSGRLALESKNGVDVKINNDNSAPVEFTLTCQAASTLNQTGDPTLFFLSSQTADYFVMFNVDSSNNSPSIYTRRTKIEIPVSALDSASTVASKALDVLSAVSGLGYTVSLDPLDDTKLNFKSGYFGYIENFRHPGNITWTLSNVTDGREEFRILDASGSTVFTVSEYNTQVVATSQDDPYYSRECTNWIRKTNLGSGSFPSNDRWYKIADIFLNANIFSNDLVGDFTLIRNTTATQKINHGKFILSFKTVSMATSASASMLLEQSGDYDAPLLRAIITQDTNLEKRLELYMFCPVANPAVLYLDMKGASRPWIRVPLQLRLAGILEASLPSGTLATMKYRNMMTTQDVFTGPLNLKSTTAPAGNPPSGEVFMWNESGKVKIRDSAGVTITLNP